MREKKRTAESVESNPTEVDSVESAIVPGLIAKTDKQELHYKQPIGMLDCHEITGRQLSEILN